MDAIKHHARKALDLMHLAGPKVDCQAGADMLFCPAVSKEALAFQDVVDLVGAGMTVNGGDLPGLPAGNAYRGVGRFGEEFLHVMRG